MLLTGYWQVMPFDYKKQLDYADVILIKGDSGD